MHLPILGSQYEEILHMAKAVKVNFGEILSENLFKEL
jgi:hypothetical protein